VTKVSFKEMYKDAEKSPHYHVSKLQLEIGEVIYKTMKEKGWNKSELARRLGVSRQFVHKLLKCDENLTLLSLVKISMVLGIKVGIRFVK